MELPLEYYRRHQRPGSSWYPSCAEIWLSANRLPCSRRKKGASYKIGHYGLLCHEEAGGRNSLVRTGQQIDWPLYMPIMASLRTTNTLTGSDEDLRTPYEAFWFNGIWIQASIGALRVVYRRILRSICLQGRAGDVKVQTARGRAWECDAGFEGVEDDVQNCAVCAWGRAVVLLCISQRSGMRADIITRKKTSSFQCILLPIECES